MPVLLCRRGIKPEFIVELAIYAEAMTREVIWREGKSIEILTGDSAGWSCFRRVVVSERKLNIQILPVRQLTNHFFVNSNLEAFKVDVSYSSNSGWVNFKLLTYAPE